MVRFLIVWSVFSAKDCVDKLYALRRVFSRSGSFVLRKILRYGHLPTLLIIARALCALGLAGRDVRRQNAVATANYRCLTGDKGRINAVWIAVRRRLLEEAATRGKNRRLRREIRRCARQLDAVVAPLHQARTPYILAPLHTVSDVLAGMVGARVTPGSAGVVISSSAERYTAEARALYGERLSWCSIHQHSNFLASELASLITDVAVGERNMIIFPDITPDYTQQAEGALVAKLPCRLFGRPARLHSGVVRLAGVISAQVIFYHLSYRRGLRIHIHPPVAAKQSAAALPGVIEQTLRQYPQEWLLWHSHSLYFINH
ncbi:lysophospholipid acyltransferase family protein [Intestinirhabdus alba]|uniref:ABC transporter n=1 Tax=Intestinirhabdus alba TaxID=2899544 RepID=A0A6L6IQ53_9ENTR|nr:ABC transporter [Intestinirhabdus alba]